MADAKRKQVGESIAFTGLTLIINDVSAQIPWGCQSDLVTRLSSYFHHAALDWNMHMEYIELATELSNDAPAKHAVS